MAINWKGIGTSLQAAGAGFQGRHGVAAGILSSYQDELLREQQSAAVQELIKGGARQGIGDSFLPIIETMAISNPDGAMSALFQLQRDREARANRVGRPLNEAERAAAYFKAKSAGGEPVPEQPTGGPPTLAPSATPEPYPAFDLANMRAPMVGKTDLWASPETGARSTPSPSVGAVADRSPPEQLRPLAPQTDFALDTEPVGPIRALAPQPKPKPMPVISYAEAGARQPAQNAGPTTTSAPAVAPSAPASRQLAIAERRLAEVAAELEEAYDDLDKGVPYAADAIKQLTGKYDFMRGAYDQALARENPDLDKHEWAYEMAKKQGMSDEEALAFAMRPSVSQNVTTNVNEGVADSDAPNTSSPGAIIDNINGILSHPRLEYTTGKLWWTKVVPGTENYDLGQKMDRLRGQTFLNSYQSLKGGGQITELEGKLATQAAAALDAAQTTKGYVKALQDYKEILARAIARPRGWINTEPGRISEMGAAEVEEYFSKKDLEAFPYEVRKAAAERLELLKKYGGE